MSLTKNSKVILSCFDDKRYYINNLESYGYGHPKIPKNNIDISNNDEGDACENTLKGKGEKRKRQEPIPVDFQAKKKKLGMFIVENNYLYVYVHVLVYIKTYSYINISYSYIVFFFSR